jgi:hypothetical protein
MLTACSAVHIPAGSGSSWGPNGSATASATASPPRAAATDCLTLRYGGLRGERLQARMLADGDEPCTADVERFCGQARELFITMSATMAGRVPDGR